MDPIRLKSRANNRLSTAEAQESTHQFLSREIGHLLSRNRNEAGLMASAFRVLGEAIHQAADEQDEDIASAWLTDAFQFASSTADGLINHNRQVESGVVRRLDRSGLGRQSIDEYLQKVNEIEQVTKPVGVRRPIERAPLREPEHDWSIKTKLEAMRSKKPLRDQAANQGNAEATMISTAGADNAAETNEKNGSEQPRTVVPSKRAAEDELHDGRATNGRAPSAPMSMPTCEPAAVRSNAASAPAADPASGPHGTGSTARTRAPPVAGQEPRPSSKAPAPAPGLSTNRSASRQPAPAAARDSARAVNGAEPTPHGIAPDTLHGRADESTVRDRHGNILPDEQLFVAASKAGVSMPSLFGGDDDATHALPSALASPKANGKYFAHVAVPNRAS